MRSDEVTFFFCFQLSSACVCVRLCVCMCVCVVGVGVVLWSLRLTFWSLLLSFSLLGVSQMAGFFMFPPRFLTAGYVRSLKSLRPFWGIVPRACEQILDQLNNEHGTEYKFEVSYVEIYQARTFVSLRALSRSQDQPCIALAALTFSFVNHFFFSFPFGMYAICRTRSTTC